MSKVGEVIALIWVLGVLLSPMGLSIYCYFAGYTRAALVILPIAIPGFISVMCLLSQIDSQRRNE